MTDASRLDRQLDYITEIDKLKRIERMISISDDSRRENSAEHSWHLGVMVPILAEYAAEPVDVRRVQTMLLVHDIVEIDAGDTFAFDAEGTADQHEREQIAAERLFGLLPPDQATASRELWDEFEAGETADARFAVAMDRFQGLLMNRANGGGTWLKHGITREQILKRMDPIRTAAPVLWQVVLDVLESVGKGA